MIAKVVSMYREAFRGLPRDVWVLSGIAFVNRAGTMVFPFLSLYFTERQGLPITVAGRIIGLYGVGAIVGGWAGGFVSDRIGAIRTQQLSLFASGAGFLAFTRIESVGGMTAGALVLGLLVESFRPANMAALSNAASREQQPRAFGLLRLTVNVGMAIGPAMGGVLALYGYGWLFLVDALTCWLAALLLFSVLRRRRMVGRPDREPPGGTRGPLVDGPFLAFLAMVFLVAMLFFEVFTVMPVFLNTEFGYREDQVGLVLALNALLIVLFEMPLTHWASHRDRVAIAAVGSFLIGFGLALTPLSGAVWWIACSVVVWTVGEMLALPMFNAIVAGRASPQTMGRYMGFYTMAFSFAFVVAPSLGSWVYAEYGGFAIWFACGVLGALAAVGGLALRPHLAATMHGTRHASRTGEA